VSAVALLIDYGTRLSSNYTCGDCRGTEARFAAYIYDDEANKRVCWYLASCSNHNDQHEAYIDATLGIWDTEEARNPCSRANPAEQAHQPSAVTALALWGQGFESPRLHRSWQFANRVARSKRAPRARTETRPCRPEQNLHRVCRTS